MDKVAAHANGRPSPDRKKPTIFAGDEKTDYSRWRLLDEHGRQTWHYLTTDEEVRAWPQTVADKYHLGLPTVSATSPFFVWTDEVGTA